MPGTISLVETIFHNWLPVAQQPDMLYYAIIYCCAVTFVAGCILTIHRDPKYSATVKKDSIPYMGEDDRQKAPILNFGHFTQNLIPSMLQNAAGCK